MDAARLNAIVYAGRGKAALRIGTAFTICRPNQPANPLANTIATIPAAFSPNGKYTTPNLYGHPIWFADLDGALVNVGDYLVSTDGTQTYFVGAKQSLLPIVAIECNTSLRLSRTIAASGIGALPYSGQSDATSDAVDPMGQKSPFVGWPCSVLIGKGAERFANAVPSSPKTSPGWQILLPASVPVAITLADRFFDATGRVFDVVQAEQTDMGWRISASEMHA